MKKTNVFGLNEHIASLLCYVFTFFSGIVILVMEKDNKTVRFHALQSTIWFLLLGAIWVVLSLFTGIPIIKYPFQLLQWAGGIVWTVSWLTLMLMAFSGRKFKIPLIGDVVEAQINR
jgi:uncharacterized membrane protein